MQKGSAKLWVTLIILAAAAVGYWWYAKTNNKPILPGRGSEIAWENVMQGQGAVSGLAPRGNYVINNASQWVATLNHLEALNVDLNQDTVIAVLSGEKPTGGHAIQISRVVEFDDHLSVSIIETAPGAGCFVTQAFTNPYHVVKIKKTGKSITFDVKSEVLDCQ